MGVKRKTKSLKIILDAFAELDHALSVVELIKRFEKDMNKTTVYRILDRLESEGFIHFFVGKDGLKWVAKPRENETSLTKENHPHFQCDECGISKCLSVNYSIPKIPNIKINAAHLILTGECENCSA